MKIFLSGGGGFIGSHLAAHFIEDACVNQVTIFDNFTSGATSKLGQIKDSKKLSVINGDIKDFDKLQKSLSGSDLVVHLAANPDISKAVTQPDIDFWQGTYLTQNILEAMRINGVNKLLYTSGSGVYGEVPGQIFDESFGPCIPISTYGASKLASESLIAAYSKMFSITSRVFRFANVVGPSQTHGVGYDFINKLIRDPKRIEILGDGSQEKSYIYVEDVIAAMVLVFKSIEDSPFEFDVFNVATQDYVTVEEIAFLACKACGLDPKKVNFEFTGGDRGWQGDVPKILFNTNKIRSLGWKNKFSSYEALEISLKSMYEEFKNSN